MNKQKEINELWLQLEHKGRFAEIAAEEFCMSPGSIKMNWISGRNTPMDKQVPFLKLLKKQVKKEKQFLKSLKQ